MKKPCVHGGLWIALALLWAGAALPGAAQTGAPPVRLGILATEPSLRPVVDVLTAEFSRRQNVAVLERAETERVYREQALSATSGDAVKLGRLLEADGLLIAGKVTDGTNEWLTLRLVAVRPGAVVDAVRLPWPVPDLVRWAGWLGARLDGTLPKLQLSPEKARPISVLNLRASVSSRAARALEEQLTALLLDRLGRERALFVLERRRMDWLARELELGDAPDAKFWNGGYLLEGVIDRDGYSPGRMTIHVRLTPPAGGKPVELAVEGPRADYVGVIEKLVENITAALELSRSQMVWPREAEAQKFFEEGRWAMQWGMYREAQSALESSWALGLQDKAVAVLRVRAWRQTGLNGKDVNMDRETGIISFGRPFVANFYDGTQIRFQSPPEPERFAEMIYALTLFEQGFNQFVAPELALDPEWLALGNDLLNDTTAWLRQFYFTVEARAGLEDQLTDARHLALRLCQAIRRHPGWRAADTNGLILATLAQGIAFWSETPEQTLEAYRELARTGDWPRVRRRFLNHGDWREESGVQTRLVPTAGLNRLNPPVAGWKWADRQRAPALWEQFVGELCNATDQTLVLEGKFLRCSMAWTGEEFEERLRDLLDCLRSPSDAVASMAWPTGMRQDLEELVKERLTSLDSRRARRVREEIAKGFETQTTPFARGAEGRANFEQTKKYFQTRNDFDTNLVLACLRRDWSAEEARELLPLVKAYRERITSGKAAQAQQDSRDRLLGQFVSKLERKLPPSVSRLPSPALPPTVRTGEIASAQSPQTRSGAVGTTGTVTSASSGLAATASKLAATTNLLRDAKFCWVARPDDADDFGLNPFVGDPCWREGRIWIELWYPGVMAGGQDRCPLLICTIDPDTWRVEQIPVEVDKSELRFPWHSRSESRVFEVHNGSLYVASGERLRRYSLRGRTWETLPIPLPAKVRLQRLGEELYLATPESILALNAQADGVRILASTRRNPPVTALDRNANLATARLFAGAPGELRVAVAGKVWSLTNGATDWTVLVEMWGSPLPLQNFENGILFGSGSSGVPGGAQIWALFEGQTQPELLLRETSPGRNPPIGAQPPVSKGTNTKPRPAWRLPAGVQVFGQQIAFDGERLWLFDGNLTMVSESGQVRLRSEAGRHGTLYGFVRGDPQPISIPLWLDVPLENVPVQNWRPRIGAAPFNETLLCATPKGLVLVSSQLPGFWFIPRAALDARWAQETRLHGQEQQAHSARATQALEALLQKFDANRDGALQPDEIQAAISDRQFLELKLDEIDANQNGRLDPEEIAFFDVNQNRRLEDPEFGAILSFLDLLADEIVSGRDQNGDGRLQEEEQDLPKGKVVRSQFTFSVAPSFLDRDRDRALSRDEIRCYLLQTAAEDVSNPFRSPVRSVFLPGRWSDSGSTNRLRTGIEILWGGKSPAGIESSSAPPPTRSPSKRL